MRTALLSLISLLVAAGAVEIVLRTTHAFNARVSWTEPDSLVGWRFTPGREYWYHAENDHPISGRINALGWRDRERTRKKPSGTFRVAVLGDSYVEAFQVELDSTFLSLAERALARVHGGPVEVMNFGRSDMTQSDELLILERDVLPCDPDVAVVLFVPSNDIADMHPATAYSTLRPFCRVDRDGIPAFDTSFVRRQDFRTRVRINPLKQRSAVVSLVAERYNAWRGAKRAAAVRPARGADLAHEMTLCTNRPDSLYAASYALAKRLLAAMHEICASRGVTFVAMAAPILYEADAVAALRARDPSFRADFFDRSLAALADSLGFAFVPLTEAFARRYAATGERLHWAHWNYTGHRVAGQAFVEVLQVLGPLHRVVPEPAAQPD